ncbi:hypothetical protein SALBM135S_00583 [Streptomyces alboniger]
MARMEAIIRQRRRTWPSRDDAVTPMTPSRSTPSISGSQAVSLLVAALLDAQLMGPIGRTGDGAVHPEGARPVGQRHQGPLLEVDQVHVDPVEGHGLGELLDHGGKLQRGRRVGGGEQLFQELLPGSRSAGLTRHL